MLLGTESVQRPLKAVNAAKCMAAHRLPPRFGVNLAGGEFGCLYGTYGQTYAYPLAQELDYDRSKGCYGIRLPFKMRSLTEAYATPWPSLSSQPQARVA